MEDGQKNINRLLNFDEQNLRINRGAKIISEKINVSEKKALELLKKFGSVRQVLNQKKNE